MIRLRNIVFISVLVAGLVHVSGNCMAQKPFFSEQRLYAPGDEGSSNWRIPALLALSDGSLLVANDRRKHNEGDLPEDIDVVCRRSVDGGNTWGTMIYVAEGEGKGRGFGDPALVQCDGGDVLCLYAGGNGYFASSEEKPIRVYMSRSKDGGMTWEERQDLTKMLWGSESQRPECRNYRGAFAASGNGMVLKKGPHKGRVLFAVAMCRVDSWASDNFIVYSDDCGESWTVSELAFSEGDEAKLLELESGDILLSVRRSGERGWNLSKDGGETWGTQGLWPEMKVNACNGDMLRLPKEVTGESVDILLHSVPNSMERRDVSLFVSYDEGKSWTDVVRLAEGPSVYSSLTLLHDGSIGAYVEKNPDGACELWFQHFNWQWIRSHKQKCK